MGGAWNVVGMRNSLAGFHDHVLVVRVGQHALHLPNMRAGTTYCANHCTRSQVGAATLGFRPEWDRYRLTPKHHAYLRVAEGCSHACTFCAIPGFRCVTGLQWWSSALHM